MADPVGDDTLMYWKIKATLMEKDYNLIKNRCENIEKELNRKKSEISSMKIALNYSDSFVMRKETELREEVERLRARVIKKANKKKEKEKALLGEITVKTQSIDDLLVKVQNLHNSLQYCKADLEKYQDDYTETKYILEVEKEQKEYLSRVLEETKQKLELTNDNFKILSQQLEIFKKEKEKFVEVLINRIQERSRMEVEKIRKVHEEEKQKFIGENLKKIQTAAKTSTDTLNSLKKYTEYKISDLRHHYENRIKNMIEEFALDQGVSESENTKLKETIRQLIQEKYALAQVNEYLVSKTEVSSKDLNQLKGELKVYKEHKDYIEIYEKIESTRLSTEISTLSQKFEETQAQITADYERQLRIIQQENEILIKHIKERHSNKLEKIESTNENLEKKEKKHYEVQIEYLLDQIKSLETEKSLLECRTIEKIETDNHELIDKNQELGEIIQKLEEKLANVQKEIEEKVRREFSLKYKQKIISRNKKFEIILNDCEIRNSSRINTLTLHYEKKVEKQRKVAKEEYEIAEHKLLQKIADLENSHGKIMTEHSNRFKQLNEKIEELKFEVDITTRQNFQKQLLINEMNEEFKQRVVFLQDQLKETEALMEKVSKEANESKEKMQKDFSVKYSEALKKFEKDKEDLVDDYEKILKDTKKHYKEKLTKSVKKLEDKISDISESMGTTIENLSTKLLTKSKLLKQQKSEITGLKTQVRYLDNSGRIFQFSSKSPVSQPKIHFDNTRKAAFLRPTSLLNYKKPNS